MKVISYLRVSTKRQGESGLGLEAQRSDIAAWVKNNDAECIREFVEVESGKHDARPKLEQAIHMADLTGARLVIAKLDRLSRSAEFLFHLKNTGCDFIALDTPVLTPITLGVFAGYAQEEREKISARTKAALAAAKARGQKLGCPLGAKAFGEHSREGADEAKTAKANAFAQKVAGIILPMKAEGMSLRAIATKLTEMNIQTQRGGAWTAAGVRNILSRIV